MFAAAAGHIEIMQLLLAGGGGGGADVTVGVRATDAYKAQVAAALLAGDAEAEVHRDGVTALHLAARGGSYSGCVLLVEEAERRGIGLELVRRLDESGGE